MLCTRCEEMQEVFQLEHDELGRYEQMSRWDRARDHFGWAWTVGWDEVRRGVLVLAGRGPEPRAWA